MVCCLLSIDPATSQSPPAIEWKKSLGGSNDEEGNSTHQTSDGGYIVAGYTKSNNGDVSGSHGNADFWVVKLTSTGSVEWQKCLGGTYEDWARSIQNTLAGDVTIVR